VKFITITVFSRIGALVPRMLTTNAPAVEFQTVLFLDQLDPGTAKFTLNPALSPVALPVSPESETDGKHSDSRDTLGWNVTVMVFLSHGNGLD